MDFVAFPQLEPAVREKVWEIYEDSFPTHEKRTYEDHLRAIKDSRFHADAVMEDGQLAGLLFYWLLDDSAYIEHFAIARSLRGQSYGTRILQRFCDQMKRVILEIDPPVDQVSVNREHFYHRLGFLSLPFAYTHPAYSKEYVPHTLVLMSYPDPMDDAEFAAFKRMMFEQIMKYSGKADGAKGSDVIATEG